MLIHLPNGDYINPREVKAVLIKPRAVVVHVVDQKIILQTDSPDKDALEIGEEVNRELYKEGVCR